MHLILQKLVFDAILVFNCIWKLSLAYLTLELEPIVRIDAVILFAQSLACKPLF